VYVIVYAPSNMTNITDQQTRVLIDGIATANHCQAGAVIALSGALAAALGQATANGTLAEGANGEAETAARGMQRRLTELREKFLALADRDATAIAEFVRLRERGQALQGYELLCDGPRDMAEAALLSAGLMQDFRPFVCEQTHDDLEFAITLMRGVAQSAMLLLDSNLHIWPFAELRAKYSLKVTELAAQIEALKPARRIRP
jgi:formiminotetrahydrofolate cyclodeaminase